MCRSYLESKLNGIRFLRRSCIEWTSHSSTVGKGKVFQMWFCCQGFEPIIQMVLRTMATITTIQWKIVGAAGIRTRDLPLSRRMLWPLSYRSTPRNIQSLVDDPNPSHTFLPVVHCTPGLINEILQATHTPTFTCTYFQEPEILPDQSSWVIHLGENSKPSFLAKRLASKQLR